MSKHRLDFALSTSMAGQFLIRNNRKAKQFPPLWFISREVLLLWPNQWLCILAYRSAAVAISWHGDLPDLVTWGRVEMVPQAPHTLNGHVVSFSRSLQAGSSTERQKLKEMNLPWFRNVLRSEMKAGLCGQIIWTAECPGRNSFPRSQKYAQEPTDDDNLK